MPSLPCPYPTIVTMFAPDYIPGPNRGVGSPGGWLNDVDALGSWGRVVRIVEDNR